MEDYYKKKESSNLQIKCVSKTLKYKLVVLGIHSFFAIEAECEA